MSRWLCATAVALVLGSAATRPAVAQPPAAVSLRAALAQARSQSPARQASAARVEAADLSQQAAGRLPNPVAELRWENWASGLPDTLPLDVFATVTQPIELGGKRGARVGLATATADGARAVLWATERELDASVARHYLSALRERDRGRLLAEQVTGLGELVRVLERRVAEGVAAEADLRKLETERARVDTDGALARIRAARELAALAALVGWTTPPPIEALERPAVGTRSDADTEAVVATALDQRPDVRLAGARVEASRQVLRFEEARRIPDLNVTGGLKRTAGYDTGVVAVVMPVPLFDRNLAAVALARGNVTASDLELAQTRRLAAAEARAALSTAAELAARLADAETRLVAPAAIVRTAARSAFESGAGDLLRLVDAERVYADARMAVTELSHDAVLAAIEARLALAEDALP